jgi:hypothetical protein
MGCISKGFDMLRTCSRLQQRTTVPSVRPAGGLLTHSPLTQPCPVSRPRHEGVHILLS